MEINSPQSLEQSFPAGSVVLASASPRRHQLLKQVVNEFEIDPADIDEDGLTIPNPYETAKRLAEAKATAVSRRHPGKWIIGSDTVVALPIETPPTVPTSWVQFSKPTDKEDALRILKALSGKTHSVITGVSIVRNGFALTDSAETKVTFHSVTDEQILSYIETGDPMDKAGAYGAQGMGNFLVESINGEFDTVIGLPVNLVRALLTKASASIPQ